jgi:hypothetical protein
MIKKIAAAATAGTIAWAGISAVDNTTRDETGQITESGDLGAFVTKVGDCVNGLSDSAYSEGVDVLKGVPCSEPHNWQVYHKENLTLVDFDEGQVSQMSNAICDQATENLTSSWGDSQWTIYSDAGFTMLGPTADSWAHEDRIVDCLIGSNSRLYTTSVFNN